MKKWLIRMPVVIVIIIVAIYIGIPSNIVISKVIALKSSSNEVNRVLNNESRWAGWWPQNNNFKQPSFFSCNGFTYHLSQKFYNSIELNIVGGDFQAISRINIIKITTDSSVLQWESRITASSNPIKRIRQYRKAIHIRDNMNTILGNLKPFLENNMNVYGVHIQQIISKDSTLISTNKIFRSYPTTAQIYELIDNLKIYISKEGGQENNFPMLSVRRFPGQKFETLVAIPVNGKLKETSTIVNKRFVPWKTLTGDVNGGLHSIENALLEMQIYIDDHQRNPMGIPFQLLITDRRVETDTLKWITKICQAVS